MRAFLPRLVLALALAGWAWSRSVLPTGERLHRRGQVGAAGLDVPPGGLQRLVAHEVGDDLDGDALGGQVVAEGMAQGVGRQLVEVGVAVDLVEAELEGAGL